MTGHGAFPPLFRLSLPLCRSYSSGYYQRLVDLLQRYFSSSTLTWETSLQSPRFLIAKDRHDEALEVLVKFHGNGERTDFVQTSFTEIKETLALEQEFSSKSGWLELIRTPGNRKRTLICYLQGFFSQWCGNGLVSYYLVPVLETIGITKNAEQAGLNGGLQIWNFIVAIWASFNIDKIGRRKMALGSTGSMIICFVLWTILSARYNITGDSADAKGVIVMIFLFYTAFNCGW